LFLQGWVEDGMTSIIHIPNIRTYAILNKKEYGLGSWKDYKKAPPEFQTDEWWKNRRL
jgi:hypothetical protein